MMRAGADDGATGENAIVYNAARVEIIMGPVAVLSANGLLGEVTPAMAAAVGESDAVKILLPSQRCRIRLAIGPTQPMQKYLDEAVRMLQEEIECPTE
jgi:mitochondrial fission protein ELM1